MARLVTDMGTVFVQADNLTKCYGKRTALNGLSLTVEGGEVTGLLGPNGAGKTTALSILATILRAHSGRASICGHDVGKETSTARSFLGLVTQSVAIYPALSGRENLEFFARMQGLGRRTARPAAQRMLEEVGLADRAEDTAESYSGGMKRRLNLACGMIHSPPVLLLDEPTVGVDPQSREWIFELIDKAAAEGRAVIYSTNYMEEAERLCHRVLLVDEGRVVADGTPQELIATAGTRAHIRLNTQTKLHRGWAKGLPGAHEIELLSGEGVTATVAVDEVEIVPAVLRRAREVGGEVKDFALHQPNLQDAFIALTGHALRDAG
ncbi:MAG TPA: ABC transporter ATP-binding protein [Candidatus Acidoferrum sp.]|nr:ABC transporter ATP-binding protein [Candidatus Acidoferrum sp.]